jgi:hypothetical protein
MRAQIVAGHHPIELIPQSFLEHAIPGVYFLTSGFMKGAPTPTRAETRDKRSHQTKQQPLQPTASPTHEPPATARRVHARPAHCNVAARAVRTPPSDSVLPWLLCVAGHHTSRRAHTGMRDVVVQGKADMYALRRTMRALVATRAYGRT